MPPTRWRFGDFLLDTGTRQLSRGQEPVHLPPKVFQLLEALLTERPNALSKEQLQERLWPGAFISEATLASVVADLREALGETAKEPRFLRTVHGFGYAFAGEAAAERPAAAPAEVTVARQGSSHRLLLADREVVLAEGESVLGREPSVAVWIDDASVSRRHAMIRVGGESATLVDLGSKNGCFVDDQRVDGERPLQDGERIRLGSVRLVYRRYVGAGSTIGI